MYLSVFSTGSLILTVNYMIAGYSFNSTLHKKTQRTNQKNNRKAKKMGGGDGGGTHTKKNPEKTSSLAPFLRCKPSQDALLAFAEKERPFDATGPEDKG